MTHCNCHMSCFIYEQHNRSSAYFFGHKNAMVDLQMVVIGLLYFLWRCDILNGIAGILRIHTKVSHKHTTYKAATMPLLFSPPNSLANYQTRTQFIKWLPNCERLSRTHTNTRTARHTCSTKLNCSYARCVTSHAMAIEAISSNLSIYYLCCWFN